MRVHRTHAVCALTVLATASGARADSQQVLYGHEALDTLPIEAPRHLGGSQYSTRFPDVTWDNDAWTLTTTTLRPNDFHAVASTANGYFGVSMASTGPFFQAFAEMQGWPVMNGRQTFGTVSGFYDRQPKTEGNNYPWLLDDGWDSVISGIPHWGPLILELEDGNYVAANTSADQFSNVTLVQDYKQGFAQWQYTWAPSGPSKTTFNITYFAFAHKLNVNRGYIRLDVSPSEDTNVTLYNILDGRNALRTTFNASGSDGNTIYTAVNPNGVDNVTAWMYSAVAGTDSAPQNFTGSKPFIGNTSSTVVQAFNLTLKANQASTFLKHVGVASSDGFSNPQEQARTAVQDSLNDEYDTIFASHAKEWQVALPATSVVNYTDPSTGLLPSSQPELIEKAIVSVVSTFALLQNTITANALSAVGNAAININGISVCGLTSDCYGGQVSIPGLDFLQS
jgi:Glycosyl hydrolase family 65, N-terminal domain